MPHAPRYMSRQSKRASDELSTDRHSEPRGQADRDDWRGSLRVRVLHQLSIGLLPLWSAACGAESPTDGLPGETGTDVGAQDVDAQDLEMRDVDLADSLSACVPVPFAEVPESGACLFYRCLDDTLGCGADAYLIDFACRYADLYLAETYAEMTGAGQAFLESAFECLQARLAAETDALTDCTAAAELGFASHVPCYLAAGFCELPLEDKLLVFAAIDPEDLEHPLQRAAQAEVIDHCSER